MGRTNSTKTTALECEDMKSKRDPNTAFEIRKVRSKLWEDDVDNPTITEPIQAL